MFLLSIFHLWLPVALKDSKFGVKTASANLNHKYYFYDRESEQVKVAPQPAGSRGETSVQARSHGPPGSMPSGSTGGDVSPTVRPAFVIQTICTSPRSQPAALSFRNSRAPYIYRR